MLERWRNFKEEVVDSIKELGGCLGEAMDLFKKAESKNLPSEVVVVAVCMAIITWMLFTRVVKAGWEVVFPPEKSFYTLPSLDTFSNN